MTKPQTLTIELNTEGARLLTRLAEYRRMNGDLGGFLFKLLQIETERHALERRTAGGKRPRELHNVRS